MSLLWMLLIPWRYNRSIALAYLTVMLCGLLIAGLHLHWIIFGLLVAQLVFAGLLVFIRYFEENMLREVPRNIEM